MRLLAFAVVVGTVAFSSASYSADIPNAKDPPFLKRYEGSEIVVSASRRFDEYKLIVPDSAHPGQAIAESHEGAITRLFYRVPPGHTALELYRNYEQTAKQAGLAIAYASLPCKQTDRPSLSALVDLVPNTMGSDWVKSPLGRAEGDAGSDGPFCFFTAKGTINGQDIALTVAVTEKSDRSDARNYSFQYDGKPLVFKPGEAAVMVDVVVAKAVENKMVEVKASDMAEALATKGTVDLYGIYFDTDKTDIKPESSKTLDEVASLLKIDRALKLEIAGHTDSTGSKEHNIQLSDGRAKAVVDLLVKKYGVDAARLQAKGYGDTKPVASNDSDDGKAKNRRVELKKL
jgi:outer membrane protein OmpA-like peptidoglycan-associated protein